jgi:hypothetical protein
MIRHAFILALAVAPVWADTCRDKVLLESFLKHEYGLRLHSWGLSQEGNMLELWLADDGLFAIVTTTTGKCSTVELPDDLHGRLWTPPSPNKAIPEGYRMSRGTEL